MPGAPARRTVGSSPVPRSRPTTSGKPRTTRTVGAVFAGATIAAASLAACNSDGRTLREAKPYQTQSVYTPTTTTVPATTLAPFDSKIGTLSTSTTVATTRVPFRLELPWSDGGTIDARFTCNGADVHPQIDWVGAPADAVEMALVVTDTDANDFVHWVIAGLDPNDPLVGEGDVPVGAIEGQNDFGTETAPAVGWRGPCPPAGSMHHYAFTLYALDQQVELPTGSPSADLLSVITSSLISVAEVTGVYTAPSDSSTTTTLG